MNVCMQNAMHWAAKHGNPEVIKLLNGYKVDADVRSFCGHTPLHLAAMSGNEECIELLVNLCSELVSSHLPFICMVICVIICNIVFIVGL